MTEQENKTIEQYLQKLPDALLNFQFIEEFLKMYIAYCYEIITLRVSSHIPFKYRYKDLKKDALGKLVMKFKKINNNDKLIGKIEKIIKDRNYCAHEAYLLIHEQQNDPEYLSKEIAKLEKIVLEAKECLQEISAELKHVEAIKNSLKESKKNV